MKKVFLNLFILTLVLNLFTACNKDEAQEETIQAISEEEAAEIIEQAISSETYGMTAQVEEVAVMADQELTKAVPACGMQFDTTIVRANDPQAIRSYNYVTERSYELICQGNVPQELVLNINVDGEYSAPRLESDDESIYEGSLTNLLPNQSQYIYNGSLLRTGSQTIDIRETRNITSNLIMETTNLLINKENQEIDSGLTTFVFTGTRANGDSFNYEGSITFNGNRSATIEINGNTFEVNW